MLEPTVAYGQLRDRVDQQVRQLLVDHDQHIICEPGCAGCCVNLSVFPVEYYAILDELRRANVRELPFDPQASCGYLRNSLCVMYPYRPLICRTHGVPIAFLNENLDPPECSVSFCPKNFVEVVADEYEFGSSNTLNIDELNQELYQINLRFVALHPELKLQPMTRIPLKKLADDVRK